jgi:paraquat-inducible protein B
MTENVNSGDLPKATVVRKTGRRISVVWAIPILAAVVAIGIFVQFLLNEGPTITIDFKAAEGIEVGKTFIKYKDVNIGQVTAVQLSEDYSKVTITAKIAKSAAGLMVQDARFWVVSPRVTLSGVSGLGTLLSGSYIGFEAGKSTERARRFTGLDVQPVITGGEPGRQFNLKADTLGSVGIGAPIYYHSLEAGQVVGYELGADGKSVDIKVFVNAPYDRYVNAETRFWNASGIDVTLGANGLQVRTESVAALIAGGIAFDNPPFVPEMAPATANTVFRLYADETSAMKQPEAIAQRYVLHFTESLRGLSVGAPVTLMGLPVGEVTDVGVEFDAKAQLLRGRVEIVSYPERLVGRMRTKEVAGAEAVVERRQSRQAVVDRMVQKMGLRAQLRSGNVLTGQLYVAFDFFPQAQKAAVNWKDETPEFPVVPSPLPNIEEKVGSILTKLDKVQYEAIGADLQKTLASFNQTMQTLDKSVAHIDTELTPELKAATEEFRRALASADKLIKHADTNFVDGNAPAQQELRQAVQELARAARSLRVLTDYLERHPEALLRGKTEENP